MDYRLASYVAHRYQHVDFRAWRMPHLRQLGELRQRTGTKLPGGTLRSYAYDAASRLTTQVESTSAGVPAMTLVDAYDNAGNRTRRTRDGAATTFTMDAGYRLTGQEAASSRATMAYDSRGNLEVKHNQGTNPMTFTVDAANRLVTMLQGAGTTTYTFDETGNMTAEHLGPGRTTYTYDEEDRLTVVQTGATTRTTYAYTGDGLRRIVRPPGGAAVQTMVWDGTDYLGEY